MLDKRASKVFRVECFRYAEGAPNGGLKFFREVLHCDVATCGPALDSYGHEYVLQVLNATFGAWLKRYWHGRALLSQGLRKHCPIVQASPAPIAEVDNSEQLQSIVSFLHDKVASPMLTPHNLTVYQVTLRDITANTAISRLPEPQCPQDIGSLQELPAPFTFKKNTRKKAQAQTT